MHRASEECGLDFHECAAPAEWPSCGPVCSAPGGLGDHADGTMRDQQSKRVDMRGTCSIARWAAWAPDVHDPSDWPRWVQGDCMHLGCREPDVHFIPPLLRRRLDPLGRMALHVAWPCARDHEALPLVFASRHGSLERTVQLLEDLILEAPLSPTAFSLSVHNSIAGLFSICRTDRSPSTALAAGEHTLGAGLLEGIGMLADGAGKVLVVYADEAIPPEYQPFVGGSNQPFAVGLLLVSPDSELPQFRLMPGHGGRPGKRIEAALMEFLMETSHELHLGMDEAGLTLIRLDGQGQAMGHADPGCVS